MWTMALFSHAHAHAHALFLEGVQSPRQLRRVASRESPGSWPWADGARVGPFASPP